jgi:hypothetical protein
MKKPPDNALRHLSGGGKSDRNRKELGKKLS